jgi:hypothetical protein
VTVQNRAVVSVAAVLVLGALAVNAQQSKTAIKPESPNATATDWARMKECTEQVEKVAKRTKLDDDPRLMGRQNHYSLNFQRCYVQISYRNPAGAANPATIPTTYYELWDAFEERLVATCNDVFSLMEAGAFCNIQEGEIGFVGCRVCQDFIKTRMTK